MRKHSEFLTKLSLYELHLKITLDTQNMFFYYYFDNGDFQPPPTEQKESVNTPQKKVPFQFMFQDKNKTNVFAILYKCEYCDKEFAKNLN